MKKQGAVILGSSICAVIFGGAGFVAGTLIANKKWKAKIETEREDLRRVYREMAKKNNITETIFEDEKIDIPEPSDEVKVEVVPDPPKEEKKAKILEDIDLKIPEDEVIVEEGDVEPYFLDENERFLDPSYTEATLYWDGKQTLYDDMSSPVDVGSTIGYEEFDKIKRGAYVGSVIIRNPLTKVDYEVVEDDGYQRDYLTPRNSGIDHSKRTEW